MTSYASKLMIAFATSAALLSGAPAIAQQKPENTQSLESRYRKSDIDYARRLLRDAQTPAVVQTETGPETQLNAFYSLVGVATILTDATRGDNLSNDEIMSLVGLDNKTYVELLHKQAKQAVAERMRAMKEPTNRDVNWEGLLGDPTSVLWHAGLNPNKPSSWEGTGSSLEEYKSLLRDYAERQQQLRAPKP